MADQQNQKLYHYTSPEGLIGIISDNCIRATDIFYVNDSEEFMRGVNIAKEMIEQLYDSKEGDEKKRLERFRKDLSYISPSQNHIPIYISSFSTEGDQLSQWRAYCHGGGFAIGFAKSGLEKMSGGQNCELKECIYDPSHHEKIIKETVNTILPWIENPKLFMEKSPGASESDVGCGISNKFVWDLHQRCSILKNSSFAEEKEWRLVTKTRTNWHNQNQFRSKKGLIIPYININLPIPDDREFWNHVEVIVGPSLFPEESRQSVKKLFRKHHGFEIATKLTSSSYREL